jgi:hypothetical protein
MSDGLTIAKLTEALAGVKKAPPCPFLASSVTAMPDKAIRFIDGEREHVLAHPDFWASFQRDAGHRANTINSVAIIDLDNPANMDKRRVFFEAFHRAAAQSDRHWRQRTLGGVINPDVN